MSVERPHRAISACIPLAPPPQFSAVPPSSFDITVMNDLCVFDQPTTSGTSSNDCWTVQRYSGAFSTASSVVIASFGAHTVAFGVAFAADSLDTATVTASPAASAPTCIAYSKRVLP